VAKHLLMRMLLEYVANCTTVRLHATTLFSSLQISALNPFAAAPSRERVFFEYVPASLDGCETLGKQPILSPPNKYPP